MNTKKRKALVTGGAGFFGPHLIAALMAQGWEVANVDNYSTGKRSHLEPFRRNPFFQDFEGSITDQAFLDRVLSVFRPEAVFHLAAIHFIPYCVAHPAETLEVNVMGTQRLLDAIAKHPVARFIFASTADVYAASDVAHAETAPLGSTNIYGISKEIGERLMGLAQCSLPQTRFLAARFFNLIGPGETNPHILPDIMTCLRKGNVLRLGNIEPKRDYIYVTDVAAAMLKLVDYSGTVNAFNVGTGESRSVRELLVLLEKAYGSPITVEVDPAKLRPSERQNLQADISLAKRELRWTPAVSYEDGLTRTLRAELE